MALASDNWVSPNYTEADKGQAPSVDNMIDIFRDRVDGWQIAIAEEMLHQIENSNDYPAMRHAGYALISVVFSYFEMIGQCAKSVAASPSPTEDFVRGFRDVYSTTVFNDEEIKIIYDRIRCGMFHNGYTKRGVFIDGEYPEVFSIKNNVVCLNPHTLVRDVRKHFTIFITRLFQPTNKVERDNLVDLFNRLPKK